MELTISTREMYRNIPAVTAKIQFLTSGLVETANPIYSPTMAVNDDKKLKTSARVKDKPLVNKIAKSPEN
jgi:hypothetical protein